MKKELVMYLIFGVITTIVNYVLYFLTKDWFGIHYIISNIIAWFGSVLFAFFTNKIYVFNDINTTKSKVITQFVKFAGFRVVSGVVETLILYLSVNFFKLSEDIVKIVASVLVVILNYVFSKLFIFKRK